jgi:quinol-cytochrome oxidoreductase complex cytochrome b subunit
MTSNDFCNWLKGYLDLTENTAMTSKQLEMVKRHLAMVFKYEIDPSYGNDEVQQKLNKIHNEPFNEYDPFDEVLIKC